MIWTLFFALVILLILGTLLWARGIRYRKGLHIHMKLGDSEVTPVLSESGHTMFDIGGKTGMLLRGENGVVQISYGDSDEDLRWLRGYRYSRTSWPSPSRGFSSSWPGSTTCTPSLVMTTYFCSP